MKREIYKPYNYIYPPRPELKIKPRSLSFYDNNSFISQPKLNGSCCEIYTGVNPIKKGRHNNILSSFKISDNEIKNIFGTNINLIIGEYMNKSKNSEYGLFNNKFVIFDQLIFDGDYLLHSTFQERLNIIKDLYKPISETRYLYRLSQNIYMVKTFYNNFFKIWDDITKIDMYEGLVLKKKNARLQRGIKEKNNVNTMIKARKPCKLYEF